MYLYYCVNSTNFFFLFFLLDYKIYSIRTWKTLRIIGIKKLSEKSISEKNSRFFFCCLIFVFLAKFATNFTFPGFFSIFFSVQIGSLTSFINHTFPFCEEFLNKTKKLHFFGGGSTKCTYNVHTVRRCFVCFNPCSVFLLKSKGNSYL